VVVVLSTRLVEQVDEVLDRPPPLLVAPALDVADGPSVRAAAFQAAPLQGWRGGFLGRQRAGVPHAAASVMVAALYLTGQLSQIVLSWPGPVVMLFLTVALKLGRLVSPSLERGAFSVYQFFRVGVTYPLLFAIGVAMTPWQSGPGRSDLPL